MPEHCWLVLRGNMYGHTERHGHADPHAELSALFWTAWQTLGVSMSLKASNPRSHTNLWVVFQQKM